MSIRHVIRNFATALLDLLYPPTCFGCKSEGAWLCATCAQQLPAAPQTCPFCPETTDHGQVCRSCTPTHALRGVIARTAYTDPLAQRLIHGLKYRYWSSLAHSIAILTAEVYQRFDRLNDGSAVFVPIPLHPSRLRARGFNQAELLSKALSQITERPHLTALQRTRSTRVQATLSKTERFVNAQGAFACMPTVDLSGKIVILVDDVCTTGATLDAAANACLERGAVEVWGLVFAHG